MFTKLIRGALALALSAAPICEARATCSLDAKEAIGTTYNPTFPTRTFAFATARPNDEIVLFIDINAETNLSYAFPSVTSVSGAGLSWSRRGPATTGSIANCWANPSPQTCYFDAEEWVATATTVITPPATITVNVNTDLAYANFNVFAVHGSSGFDPNPSLPAINTNFTTVSSPMQVTGFSTSEFPDLALFACNVFYGAYGGFECGYRSTSPLWTAIVGNWQGLLFTSFGVQTQSFYRPLTGSVTGITLQPFSDPSAGYIAQGDALTCNAGSAFPQVQIIE